MKDRTRALLQLVGTTGFIIGNGTLSVLHAIRPATGDTQGIVEMQNHPIASISGAVFPTLLLAPVVYWMIGWLTRRVTNRGAKPGVTPNGASDLSANIGQRRDR